MTFKEKNLHRIKQNISEIPWKSTSNHQILQFFLFNLLLGSLQNLFLCVSDLKVICAQSWGHIEAL